MDYLLMIYDDEKVLAAMTEADRGSFMKAYADFTQEIVKSGHFRGGSQLKPSATATTVRGRGGTVLTVDGPFAESKEQLGGFFIVECKDLDEALAIARRLPSVQRGGSIEVRPIVSRPPVPPR